MAVFRVVLEPDRKAGAKLTVWERVHHKDEAELQRDFAEAKKEGRPHVKGHSIHSIKRLRD